MCSRLPYSVSLGYRGRAVTHNRNCYLFIPDCRIVVFLIDRHQITFFVHIGRELRRTFRSLSFVFKVKLKQRGNTVNSRRLLRIYSGREIMSLQVLSNNAQQKDRISKQKAQKKKKRCKILYIYFVFESKRCETRPGSVIRKELEKLRSRDRKSVRWFRHSKGPPKTGECFSQTSVRFAVDFAVQSAKGVDRSTV